MRHDPFRGESAAGGQVDHIRGEGRLFRIGATEIVTNFIVRTGYDQIPGEAVSCAKRAILDGLGCILAGSQESSARIVTGHVKEMGGSPEATVIAGGFKTSAPQAALANGTMAHALDYDDVAMATLGHPTVALLPAVLALGETGKLCGKDALASYIIGFEVMGKIGACIGFGHYGWGWHATVTLGTMGAAAASARMLRLDTHQTMMTLGIAASLAGGTRQNFGTMTKPLHAGNAARNGVVASLLAKKGFTADEAILESPMGFLKIFSGGAEYDVAKATEGLGTAFDIVSPGVGMKPYPCCLLTHRCIDAILHLIKENGIGANAVERVECRTSEFLPQVLIHSRPKTALEGKFSMQYCMAIALLDGRVGLKQFTDEKVLGNKAQQLLKRVEYVHPEGLTPLHPDVVTIRLKDGREISHEVAIGKGDSRNPMTEEELTAKYRDCASFVLSPEGVEKSLDMISRLEDLNDITLLMHLLCLKGEIA